MGQGTITYQLWGKQCASWIGHAHSSAHVQALAWALHDTGMTHAAMPDIEYREAVYANIPENSPPSTTDVGLFANVILRREADGLTYGLLIHAPNLTLFEAIQDQGYRVTQTSGEEIAALYSACAGETFLFCEGWLQGDSTLGVPAP